MYRYLNYFFIPIYCLSFSSCFLIPCNTTLYIENLSNNTKILLIDYEKNTIESTIHNGEKLFYKNEIMNNINYVYIRSETIEGIFELREYDHWFATKHNIEIIIRVNNFDIFKGGKKIIYEVSYEWEAEKMLYHWDEVNKKVIEEYVDSETIFEKIKEQRYKKIYDIIKK